MAFVKHVRCVLLRGRTDQVTIALKNIHFQRLQGFTSLQRSNSQLFQDIRLLAWAVPNVNSLSSVNFYSRVAGKFNSRGQNTPTEKSDTQVPSCANEFNPALVEELLNKMEGDLPVASSPDPFEKDYHRCFICRYNIEVDHKNIRLLSQFVSPFTGRIYGRQITGLCIPMQNRVSQLIKRARLSGFMPFILKDPKYLQDPQPYDAMSKFKH
ncbi:unnamed protein product [Candidula unifasciata]|uniref:Mitochondrial ribosomal protein S18C n=1 Tax=Candidula unifasciata TaxID=100452 RepID=A0A8S3ZVL4_9EUPU|nr:unnamed protein product [Candidula unifasciata]